MACFSCGARVFGRAVSRRESSASASASCCRVLFHSLSRARATSRLSGRPPSNGAWLCWPGSGLVRPAGATGPAPDGGQAGLQRGRRERRQERLRDRGVDRDATDGGIKLSV